MADLRISDLVTASQLKNDDYYEIAQSESGTRVSYKTTLLAIAVQIATMVDFTSDLNTTSKKITGAINELKQLISLIPQFSIEVVEELPTEDISDTTIYLVPSEDPEVGNYYEEYIHVNNTWELVGTTAVDLSAYYTKLEVDGLLATKASVAEVALKENKSDMPTDVRTIIKDCKTPKSATITNGIAQFECIEENLVKGLKVTMNPIQDLSHGDPSPTNICPISGRTEASVTRTAGEDVETHTHQYGQTVYGGEDDFVNGVCSNERNIKVYDGTEDWQKTANGAFRVAREADIDNTKPYISNMFTQKSSAVYEEGKMYCGGTYLNVFVSNTVTTVEDFKAILSANNLQFVYYKTTPTTIQTSAEDITTVEGTNIISGTEPISECKYTELATVDDLIKIIGGQ